MSFFLHNFIHDHKYNKNFRINCTEDYLGLVRCLPEFYRNMNIFIVDFLVEKKKRTGPESFYRTFFVRLEWRSLQRTVGVTKVPPGDPSLLFFVGSTKIFHTLDWNFTDLIYSLYVGWEMWLVSCLVVLVKYFEVFGRRKWVRCPKGWCLTFDVHRSIPSQDLILYLSF